MPTVDPSKLEADYRQYIRYSLKALGSVHPDHNCAVPLTVNCIPASGARSARLGSPPDRHDSRLEFCRRYTRSLGRRRKVNAVTGAPTGAELVLEQVMRARSAGVNVTAVFRAERALIWKGIRR